MSPAAQPLPRVARTTSPLLNHVVPSHPRLHRRGTPLPSFALSAPPSVRIALPAALHREDLPASYAKNYKRGLDRFLCLHLGVEPDAVEQAVREAGDDDTEVARRLRSLFPADVRAAKWNRELVQKGMTPAGRDFLRDALTAMGCADRVETIISVPDLIDFDEGRID